MKVKSPKSPIKSQKLVQNHNLQNTNNKIEETKTLRQLQIFKDKFKKIVINPMNNIQTIQRAKMPQRCVQHNNTISLYCVFDRKPLCVSCVYTDVSHKKHQVVPIQRSTSFLKQDSKGFQNRIQQVYQSMKQNILKSGQNIVAFQKFIPKILYQLTKFYAKLKQKINQCQNQQVGMIKQFRQNVKQQHMIINQQFRDYTQYLKEKQNEISKYGQEDQLVKRNSLQILSKTYKIFPKKIIQQKSFKNLVNLRQYSEIEDLIQKKLSVALTLQNYYASIEETNIIDNNKDSKERKISKVKFQLKLNQSKPNNGRDHKFNKSLVSLKNASHINVSPKRHSYRQL